MHAVVGEVIVNDDVSTPTTCSICLSIIQHSSTLFTQFLMMYGRNYILLKVSLTNSAVFDTQLYPKNMQAKSANCSDLWRQTFHLLPTRKKNSFTTNSYAKLIFQ